MSELRERLDPIVEAQIKSAENRRIAIDILTNIWGKSALTYPVLHRDATSLYQQTVVVTDRLWLHYGMTMLVYDFFRLAMIAIGELARYEDDISPKAVKSRLVSDMGQFRRAGKGHRARPFFATELGHPG